MKKLGLVGLVTLGALSISAAALATETTPEKGNNGWGNGAEGTNNGSFAGGSENSKSTEAASTTNGNANAGGNGNHTAR